MPITEDERRLFQSDGLTLKAVSKFAGFFE
jgi:hypothetical protein